MQLYVYSSFAAIQVSLAQQNYTITEGDIVNITLHLSTIPEFDFTVTLQHMNGSATGETTACGGYVCEGILQSLFHPMCDNVSLLVDAHS